MAGTSRIVELANIISASTETVDRYLSSNGLSQPSFDEGAPKKMVLSETAVEQQRIAAISAAAELQDLLQGPHAALTPIASVNATGLEAIYKWSIATHVPRDSEISYADLAARVGMREALLKRIVRFVIPTHRCFQEKNEGYVSHSAASRLLCDSPDMYNTVGMMFAESWHAFARTCDAIQFFDSEESNQSAFSLAFSPGKTMWEHYDDHPEKAKRFARSMESLQQRPGYSVAPLVRDYPWQSLEAGAKVVDVGGGQGHASVAISQQFPKLAFVVQDLPDVIEVAKRRDGVPKAVEFMEHDFFTGQHVQADVYLFRWVLHDWPDEYVVRIIRNLIPALRDGARVVINDSIMPKLGTIPLLMERRVRQYDMCMQSLFNSKEREESEWYSIFEMADARFKNVRSWTPKGSVLSIIEATWVEGS